MTNPINVYILSDSGGESAERVIKAGLAQFNCYDAVIHIVAYVANTKTIDDALTLASEHKAIVGFTLIDPKLRRYVNKHASEMNIEAIDIMRPIMSSLERVFQEKPLSEPGGAVHKLDEDYFNRIEAIEFAVKYDDGRDMRGIARADIVLIGVSRTSKTPLSQYLALKSLKVANVPIVPEVDPPEELFTMDPQKFIGLSISSDKLNEIRKERLKSLGLGDQAMYANMKRIEQELDYFNHIVEKIGCPVIDVSNKAVEETASIILKSIQNERI